MVNPPLIGASSSPDPSTGYSVAGTGYGEDAAAFNGEIGANSLPTAEGSDGDAQEADGPPRVAFGPVFPGQSESWVLQHSGYLRERVINTESMDSSPAETGSGESDDRSAVAVPALASQVRSLIQRSQSWPSVKLSDAPSTRPSFRHLMFGLDD
jgi:hypothetical protein